MTLLQLRTELCSQNWFILITNKQIIKQTKKDIIIINNIKLNIWNK
jgi:hypothetical protein